MIYFKALTHTFTSPQPVKENLKPIVRKWSCKNNKYGAKIFNMLYTISLVEKLPPNI